MCLVFPLCSTCCWLPFALKQTLSVLVLKVLHFIYLGCFFTEVCKYLRHVSVWSFASFCAVTAKQLFQGLVFGFFLPGIFKGLQSLQMSVYGPSISYVTYAKKAHFYPSLSPFCTSYILWIPSRCVHKNKFF